MEEKDKVVILYADRIEPLLDALADDNEKFGRLMKAFCRYALYGEISKFDDPFEKFAFAQLKSMTDIAKQGNRKFRVNQTINANVGIAKNEDDMRERLQRKGLDSDEIDLGLERFRKRRGNSPSTDDFLQDDVAEELKKRYGVGRYSG